MTEFEVISQHSPTRTDCQSAWPGILTGNLHSCLERFVGASTANGSATVQLIAFDSLNGQTAFKVIPSHAETWIN
jgi:hypothetical protein